MTALDRRKENCPLGGMWDIQYGRELIRLNGNVDYFVHGEWTSVSTWRVHIQIVVGVVVNIIYAEAISALTPLCLMQSHDGMDFVQNALAVTFITTLDDESGKMIVRPKHVRVDEHQDNEGPNEANQAEPCSVTLRSIARKCCTLCVLASFCTGTKLWASVVACTAWRAWSEARDFSAAQEPLLAASAPPSDCEGGQHNAEKISDTHPTSDQTPETASHSRSPDSCPTFNIASDDDPVGSWRELSEEESGRDGTATNHASNI